MGVASSQIQRIICGVTICRQNHLQEVQLMPITNWRSRSTQINFPSRLVAVVVATLTFAVGANFCTAATLSTPANGLTVQVDETKSTYEIALKDPAWTFGGSLSGPITNVVVSRGNDSLGSYQQVGFAWSDRQTPMTGWIRAYDESPFVLFSETCNAAVDLPPAPFPSFTKMPTSLHIYSHSLEDFAPPRFTANENGTPWLLFDDQANALMISPTSHFMVASMLGDGSHQMASGFNNKLRGLPAGFTQQTILVFGKGINRACDLWGHALLGLEGAKRPGNEADTTLKYLGYWTDNGAAYYYNYNMRMGYAGTLQALVKQYQEEQIPIRYLQLDSWWYHKSLTGPNGEIGKPKNLKLPEGKWNRYGGLLEYKADKFLFPDGLDAYQKSIGLPLVTHNRWVDLASPYREKYKISGVAAVDPKWWDDEIAAYIKSCGVVTYEQDWLDRIYESSPAFSSNIDTADAFLDNMARANAAKGITMQYCMPYACYFLQGSHYPNLTTIRTSGDRFGTNHWNDFIYTSRLASSLGIWPWADVFHSTETDNLLLSTLSAGPVGIGDALGAESRTNLLKAIRTDGVIVKPDAPIVPIDRTYIADAQHANAPLVASTYTQHGEIRTEYVFAFNRLKTAASQILFTPAELGMSGPVYLYDYFSGTGQRLEAETCFSTPLDKGSVAYYILAPIGRSGIAFLGDIGKFVSCGKQRIVSLTDEPGELTVSLVFAKTEKSSLLHGYAAEAPEVTTQSGKIGALHYDPRTQHFEVEVYPDSAAALDMIAGDPVRHMTVILKTSTKLDARR